MQPLLRKNGAFLERGLAETGNSPVGTPRVIGRDLVFANCYSISDERHDFDVALDILSSGRLPLRDLVTHTFPLVEAREALETAYDKSTRCIKVQLVP